MAIKLSSQVFTITTDCKGRTKISHEEM